MRDRSSGWELAPAYDLTYSAGIGYTQQHQMTIAGRSDGFAREDLISMGKKFDIHTPEKIIDVTVEVFSKWAPLGKEWGVSVEDVSRVSDGHRLYLSSR